MFKIKSRSRKTVLTGIIAAALAASCFVSPLTVPTVSADISRPSYSSPKSYRAGDIVKFGSYEQDNVTSNGAEPIEWIVLTESGDAVLLISRYALASERYHYRKANVTWETCSVREWLNDDFYYDAFDYTERSRILSSYRASAYTADYVFALDVEEAEYYFSGNKDRICTPTAYCAAQNVYVNPSTGGCWWLLSTTGKDGQMYAMSVNSDGTIDYKGGRVQSNRGTVRPAIWISK